MNSPAKRKGTAFESALVTYIADRTGKRHGIAPRRVAQSGQLDTGDIHGISPFVGQAKNYRDLTAGLRDGLSGAEIQKTRAGEPFGVAFVKRIRKPVGQSYAVMTVETFSDVLARLRQAEREVEGITDELT